MYIAVVVGSGIKNGNTARLAKAFAAGAQAAGHRVEYIFLGEKRIEGCRGCGGCQRNGGRCVLKDDMEEIYPILKECQMVVMASPLYFWTISGRLKSFVDRFYALGKKDRYPYKETVLLMTAGDNGEETFREAVRCYQVLCSALKWSRRGMYLAGGCVGGEAEQREIKEEHLEKAYQLGMSIK